MADDKIVHRISLEGADDVANKLKKIGDTGSDAFKKVKQYTDDSASGLGSAGNAFAALEGKTEGGRLAAERFRETLHTLHPILDTAGLGLGNLGAFARVAGAGMGALGVAIVGSVVVGLAKLADQAAITKKQLDDLSPGQGGSHFAGLQQDAKRLGTDIGNLIPAYQQLLGLRNDLNAGNRNEIHAPGHEPFNLSGGPLSNENLHGANNAVQSFFAAGKADDPAKATADFFAAIRKAGGNLTPEALQGAAAASPGAANKIAQSLPEGFSSYQQAVAGIQGGRHIGVDELFLSLAKAAPEAEKSAQAVRGLKESLDGAAGSSKEFLKSLAGENAGQSAAARIDKLTSGIDKATEFIKKPYPLPTSDTLADAAARRASGQFGVGEPKAPTPTGGLNVQSLNPPPAPSAVQQPSGAATNGPRSDAGDTGQQQQLASLSENFQAFIESVNAALSRADKRDLDLSGQPVEAVGIRGATGGHIVRMAEGGQARLNVSPGGHLSGPGTGTSDSIPADVANGEFVVNAKDTAKNLDLLHDINSGKVSGGHHAAGGFVRRFADGGFAATGNSPIGTDRKNNAIYGELTGSAEVTYDPDSGGAYINGNLFPPGNPLLDDPRIKAAIERSKASMQESPSSRSGSDTGITGNHTDITGNSNAGGYAGGGLVGGSFVDRLNAMGFAKGGFIDVPHLAVGGMPDHAPVLSESSSAFSAPSGSNGGADLSHFGTVDLRTNHGDFRVMSHETTLRHMNTAAVEAKTFSTGKKPAWYGSGA